MNNYLNANPRPIFSEVQSNISELPEVATIEASSPWKDVDVSFFYVKVDYPRLHTHTHWELFVVLSGGVTHEINGETFTLKKGDACLIRPQDRHQLYDSFSTETDSYQNLNFLMSSDYMRQLSNSLDENLYANLMSSKVPLCFSVENSLLKSMTNRTIVIQSEKDFTPDNLFTCKLIFQELYLQFLNQFFRSPSSYPDWLLQFLVLLQDSNSFSVPVAQLAHASPYSYSRLIRIFKSYTGISLIDYTTNIKITHAKSLLKNTDMTMLAISSALDFSVSYFNKLFKKKVGVTPGDYRKNHQDI